MFPALTAFDVRVAEASTEVSFVCRCLKSSDDTIMSIIDFDGIKLRPHTLSF